MKNKDKIIFSVYDFELTGYSQEKKDIWCNVNLNEKYFKCVQGNMKIWLRIDNVFLNKTHKATTKENISTFAYINIKFSVYGKQTINKKKS